MSEAHGPAPTIDQAKFDQRLKAQIDHLRATAQSMLEGGASEEAIAALFAMHGYIDDLATRPQLAPDTPEYTSFLGQLRDGIWGLYRGLLMGDSDEREDQLRELASASRGTLQDAFRGVLVSLNGGKKIGGISSRGTDEFKL